MTEDGPVARARYDRERRARMEAEAIAERALAQAYEAAQRVAEAQRIAHMGSWAWDLATGRVDWSDELYSIFGQTPGSPVSYETFLSRVHPDDRARVDE